MRTFGITLILLTAWLVAAWRLAWTYSWGCKVGVHRVTWEERGVIECYATPGGQVETREGGDPDRTPIPPGSHFTGDVPWEYGHCRRCGKTIYHEDWGDR